MAETMVEMAPMEATVATAATAAMGETEATTVDERDLYCELHLHTLLSIVLLIHDINSDLLFLQDCTGSQQPYIKASTDSILNISKRVSSSGKLGAGALRVGLVAFRDVGDEYITKPFGFTSDVSVMQKNLSTLVATGGGDGPEDITAALDVALASSWRVDAIKMVILISDAPPHGIGEPGDVGKSSVSSHPVNIARRMAELGITIVSPMPYAPDNVC